MTLRFGTDGIRGVANVDLTPELVLAVGRAAVRTLAPGLAAPRFCVARDTRRSGPLLESALVAGLCAEGADVDVLGVLPTPGLAHAARAANSPGAMLSASHNPFSDNGIKCFTADGRKLGDELESRLEAELRGVLDHGASGAERLGLAVGTSRAWPEARDEYVAWLVGALEGRRLEGLRVVVDCGHGAAYEVAPAAMRALGAQMEVINAQPDGTNINAGCGSTDPAGLQRAVVTAAADAGLAFDGDADRVIAVDEHGAIVDGDRMLAIAALDLRARGRLPGDTIAATVMSNLGLRRALAVHGIRLVETPVGDRNVRAAMDAEGLALGGEQSGHVIFADLAGTGDGTLTGLLLLDVVVRRGEPLSKLGSVMTRSPQVLRNVRVARRDGLDSAAAFWTDVRAVEAELGDSGRVLVRPSGTEPLVRVMVEAPTDEQAEACAARLADGLRRALGAEAANPGT